MDREKDKLRDKPPYIKEILQYKNREQLLEHLIECDMIVYDITEQPDIIDEAVWVVSELHADLDRLEKPKMFILISSVMTWANSKPLDPVKKIHNIILRDFNKVFCRMILKFRLPKMTIEEEELIPTGKIT